MTIVAGFCGFGGTILCADSLETVDNYSKRKVRKILDLEVGGPPFNVAIAGAGNDGSYIDSLTEEMTESLYRLDEASLDLSAMVDAISSTVHTFYERHIWPLGSQDSMVEFLIVIQEPKSEGYLFHVHGTTVNRIQDRKTIGIGSMFADVVLDNTLSSYGDELHLTAVAVNMLKEVRDHIVGCGEDPLVYLYRRHGGYILLLPNQIEAMGKVLAEFKGFIKTEFYAVTDLQHRKHEHGKPESGDADISSERLTARMEDIQNKFTEILRMKGEFRKEDLL